MSQPTQIFLGGDGADFSGPTKLKLHFVLWATARNPRIIETMFVRVKSGETSHSFPVWVTGSHSKLSRAFGLVVTPDGVGTEHHFLLASDDSVFPFKEGPLKIEVLARIVGSSAAEKLGQFEVELTGEHIAALTNQNTGVYFDWGGERQEYRGKVLSKSDVNLLPEMAKLMTAIAAKNEDQIK